MIKNIAEAGIYVGVIVAIAAFLWLLVPIGIRFYGWWWAFVLEGVCSCKALVFVSIIVAVSVALWLVGIIVLPTLRSFTIWESWL